MPGSVPAMPADGRAVSPGRFPHVRNGGAGQRISFGPSPAFLRAPHRVLDTRFFWLVGVPLLIPEGSMIARTPLAPPRARAAHSLSRLAAVLLAGSLAACASGGAGTSSSPQTAAVIGAG